MKMKRYIKSDRDWHARDMQNKEIYREAFGSLIEDSPAQDFDNSPYGTVHYPGYYRVLVDGTYETEFSAETREEAIQKFKDYFKNSRGINNSRKIKSSKRPIKSGLDDETFEDFRNDLFDAIAGVYQKYNMSGRGPMADKEDFDSVIQWMEVHDFWADPEEFY